MKTLSFRARLMLLNGVVTIVILMLAGMGIWWTIRTSLLRAIDGDLASRGERFARGQGRGRPRMEPPWGERGGPPRFGPDPRDYGRPRALSEGMRAPKDVTVLDEAGLKLAHQGKLNFATVMMSGEPIRVYSFPMRRNGGPAQAGQIGTNLSDYDRILGSLGAVMLTLLPLGLLMSAAAAWFLAGRALAPIQSLIQTAEKIDSANLSARLPVKGADELAQLGLTFNRMVDRLEREFDERAHLVEKLKQFVADASHELRTPLTRIKLSTSAALSQPSSEAELREALVIADAGVDRVTDLAQQLLVLARADGFQDRALMARVLWSDIVAASLDLFSWTDGPDLRVSVPPGSSIMGFESDLVRGLANLIDNARRYGGAGVTIDLEIEHLGGSTDVRVRDSGPGVPIESLELLGERFFRIDRSRTRGTGGTGLGLSISRAIAVNHGGSLRFESVAGAGFCAILSFPDRG